MFHILLLFFFTFFKPISSTNFYTNVCTTSECFTTGFLVNQSMKINLNPCENFYQFSCGDYKVKTRKPKHEMFWNRWTETEHLLKEKIRKMIEREHHSKNIIKQFYKSCLENGDYEKDLVKLIEIFGSWPIVKSNWNETNFNWLLINAEFIKLFKIFPLVKINVQIDFKNTSKYALYISPPNLSLPKYILLNPNGYSKEIFAYKKWILDTITYLYPQKNLYINTQIDEILQFESKLAKIIHQRNQKREILSTFNKKTSQNFTEILNVVFSEVNITILNEDFIYYTDYIFNLLKLIKETKKSTVSNYLIWCLIKELSRDVSNVSRKLNFEINKAILGIQLDIPREEECISKLTEYMSDILMNDYIRNYLKNDDLQLIKVNRMAENIKSSFIKILKKNKWLSSMTKKLVIEKILAVKFYVGFPSWIKDFNRIEEIYKDFTISSNYFANVLELKRVLIKRNLRKFLGKVYEEWPDNLFDVNAYYNVLQNSIIISIGLLNQPFFHKDRPAVLNYGALGTLIGHELAHALDETGRKSDKNGNTKRWFPIKDLKIYNKHMECFEKRYKKYNGYFQDVIVENLADIIGLQISYEAYLSSKKISGVIPFLESFNDEEVFFITYAQLWCEINQNDEILQEDEHPPVEIRVSESVENNEEFLKVFNCKNEFKKCTFW